jgi:hypothetical protein
MKGKCLIWSLTAASLIAPASVGMAKSEEPQNSTAHAVDHVSGPLPRAVREATERFQDVNNAIADGYVQNGGCVSGPQQGAMGVHYVKPALFDDKIDVENPEALVYEPRRGRLQLVAAEYITPAAAWEGSHAPGDMPQLMGHLYHLVAGPNRYGPDSFYEIHVWAWKGNHHGTFSDWNPEVSCSSWAGTF